MLMEVVNGYNGSLQTYFPLATNRADFPVARWTWYNIYRSLHSEIAKCWKFNILKGLNALV